MTDDKMNKKRAAALAAVSAYIKTQEESAAALMMGDDAGPKPQTSWGISHRMDMMAMRNMMQMKVFHGVFK